MVFVIRRTSIALVLIIIAATFMVSKLMGDSGRMVSAVPVTNRTVIVDAGHGGIDGGAVGVAGTVEKDINLKVALKLQALLEQSGCAVFMTRTEDTSIHDKGTELEGKRKISDLDNRRKMSESYRADAYVSIHMNTFPKNKYFGSQVFFATYPPSSRQLGEILQESINNGIDNGNIRVAKEAVNNIYILSNTKVPSTVVECGFLSNAEEEALLKTEEYQRKLAFCIYSGIVKYFAAQ